MTLSIPSVSLLLLPRGAPSLESHSPSSPFTHHEEKSRNMWCASLILSRVYSVIFPAQTFDSAITKKPRISDVTLPHEIGKILLFKYCRWHFWLMKGVHKSQSFLKSPFHHKNTHLLRTVFMSDVAGSNFLCFGEKHLRNTYWNNIYLCNRNTSHLTSDGKKI